MTQSAMLGRTTLAAVLAAMVTVGAAPLSAQAAASAPPRLSMEVRRNVSKLSAWPGTTITVDRDAWVAAFAVTRGARSLPLQVLFPTAPGKAAFVKAGQQVPLRRLDNREALHLVNFGEAPVVVVFASAVAPDLSAFIDGGRWGHDLLLGNAVADQLGMVELLGTTVFGYTTPYSVEVRSTAEPAPAAPRATSWSFDNSCTGSASGWIRKVGPDGAGLYGNWDDVDPAVRIMAGQSTPTGFALRFGNNTPVEVKGGGRVGVLPPVAVGASACRGYRVAWWPRHDLPLPADSTARGALLQPRYPNVSVPVGTVPGARAASAGELPRTDGVTTPRIIVDPREAARDPQAIRSLQGVSRPGGDGSVRPGGH